MQIEIKDAFAKGYSDRKLSEKKIIKQLNSKGFDVANIEFYTRNNSLFYYHFTADITPSKEKTKQLENEILEKLDTLFSRKKYSKEEKIEITRLIQLCR